MSATLLDDGAPPSGGREIRILIVDDDATFLRLLAAVLAKEGYVVSTAASGPEALAFLERDSVDVVLADLAMPEMDGIELIGRIRESQPLLPILLMTAFAEDRELRRAMGAGAADFLPKPASARELAMRIERALSTREILAEIEELRRDQERARAGRRKTDLLIGGSEATQSIYRQIVMLAKNDVTVLIEGESGTGKELVARTLHLSGPRCARPFLVVNCGAIPENLLEDELFGHERGSFTGAFAEREGVFEEADGGTVLLDEIGELPLSMQVKLLRFLQTPEFRRIGGKKTIRPNLKVLAATNRDLETEVRAGRFRQDLFYRINVVPIRIPPLRDRPDDIPLLVGHFLRLHGASLGRSEVTFSGEALERLVRHRWPGNVRELENVVRKLLITVERNRIEAEDLVLGESPQAFEADLDGPLPEVRRRAIERVERDYVARVLARSEGNLSAAARLAGMDRKNFWTLARRHGFVAAKGQDDSLGNGTKRTPAPVSPPGRTKGAREPRGAGKPRTRGKSRS